MKTFLQIISCCLFLFLNISCHKDKVNHSEEAKVESKPSKKVEPPTPSPSSDKDDKKTSAIHYCDKDFLNNFKDFISLHNNYSASCTVLSYVKGSNDRSHLSNYQLILTNTVKECNSYKNAHPITESCAIKTQNPGILRVLSAKPIHEVCDNINHLNNNSDSIISDDTITINHAVYSLLEMMDKAKHDEIEKIKKDEEETHFLEKLLEE